MNETIQPETADRENNGLEAKDNSAVENGRGKRKKGTSIPVSTKTARGNAVTGTSLLGQTPKFLDNIPL